MVKADLGAVAAIEREAPSSWSARSLAEELQVSQANQGVAESAEKEILGWYACREVGPEAELLKIAVKKANRERGVGRFLLGHLFLELQKRKVACLFLEVRSGNRTAIRFYEKNGFLQVGVRPGYYTDPPDSALILKKNLS
jgi:ribosomal-protein-alanine acetyltransferase